MQTFDLLTNLISKVDCCGSYIYIYVLGIILGIIIIIRVPGDGGQEEYKR